MDLSYNNDRLLDMTPVYPAIDVVQQMIEDEKRAAAKKAHSVSSHSSAGSAPQQQQIASKDTLGKTASQGKSSLEKSTSSASVATTSSAGRVTIKSTTSRSSRDAPPTQNAGKLLNIKSQGGDDDTAQTETNTQSQAIAVSGNKSGDVPVDQQQPLNNQDEEESYEKVLWSYSTMTSAINLSSTPDIDSTMAKLVFNQNDRYVSQSKRLSQSTSAGKSASDTRNYNSKNLTVPASKSIVATDRRVRQQPSDYEIVPKSAILDVYSSDPEVERFLHQLPRLSHQFGYNQQDFKCYSCRRPIGMIYGPSRICHYDGHLYCCECHINETSLIPARILCNWDFQRYPVSKRNQNFLGLISTEPLFDLKTLAPLLYSVCPEMGKVLDLRSQAFFLRSYCFTCTQDTISFELTKLVWPREHLIEHIHLYSLEDLEQVKTGSMATLLKKVITFARKHVLLCLLCSQKGFICELCKSTQILYPFDTDSIYRCDKCQSVFHMQCFSSLSSAEQCPRCSRLRGRQKTNNHASGSNALGKTASTTTTSTDP